MPRKKTKKVRKRAKRPIIEMPIVNENAGGIDIGGNFHMVCPRQGQVKKFGVVTRQLHELAKYLKTEGITTVAIESTGYHWKPLFILLQDYGFEVILVNARHIKNVRGRKTDVIDSQWIQLLHSLGLLNASFQLDNLGEELRSYTRHRAYLIQQRSKFINKLHAALIQMNIQLPTVIRDLTGKTGKAIIEAINEGQRSAEKLADLADPRIKATRQQMIDALTGTWREELLFQLKQCYKMYETFTEQIEECDHYIEKLLETEIINRQLDEFQGEVKKKHRQKNDPTFDVATLFFQLTGINLSDIGGIGSSIILTLFSEVGWDFSKFKSVAHFRSWLGSCPNPKVSGGRIISRRGTKKKNRALEALKRAANSIGNSKTDPLYGFFQKMNRKYGRLYAIKATANKLATIIYMMATKGEAYNYMTSEQHQFKLRQKSLKAARNIIHKNGLTLEELGFQRTG